MKLIAGIDPGTTVGWSLLDVHGKVIATGSQKELNRDSLVAKFTKYGKVILVGSDKAKIPSFVQETATKLGAKVVGPQQDLRVDEKRGMTAQYKFENAHEMDALASAQVALRKVQPLLAKIRTFLDREKHLGLFEDLFELVLKEEISIRAAFAILTPKEEVIVESKEEEKRDEDVVKLYAALSKARKDNAFLLGKNRELEARTSRAERAVEQLKQRMTGLIKPKTQSEIVKVKESQIASLAQLRENALKAQEQLKRVAEQLERALLQQDRVAVPKLSHLGWDEVLRNKQLIQGTVIFVDDANQMSEKAIQWLKEKGIQLVLSQKLAGKNAYAKLPFAVVQAQEYERFDNVILVSKSWLEKVRSERAVLAKIVESYKKERSNVDYGA